MTRKECWNLWKAGGGGGQGNYIHVQEQEQVPGSGGDGDRGGKKQESYLEERTQEKCTGKPNENLMRGWVRFPEVKVFRDLL